MNDSGHSTIEALAALGLLGIAGAALLHSIASASGMRAVSTSGLEASSIAASTVEYLVTGNDTPPTIDPQFERSWSIEPVEGHPGLARYEVVVEWRAKQPEAVELRGYLWLDP